MKFNRYCLVLLVFTAANPMGARLKQIFLQNKKPIVYSAIFEFVVAGRDIQVFNAKKKEVLSLPDASEQEQEFARQQFKTIGIKNPESVQVKIGNQFACWDDIVMIDHSYRRQHLLTQKKYDDQEILQFQGGLQHEGNHVKFNHSKKSLLVHNIAIGSAYFAYLKTNKPLVLMLSVVAALGVCHAQSYCHEWQADNNIQNDPAILRAEAKCFREYNENYQYRTLFSQFKDVHPHPLKRAQKFEDRAHQAEKEISAKK